MIYTIQRTLKASTIGEIRKSLEGLSDDIRLLDRIEITYMVHRTANSILKTKEQVQQAATTHVGISEDLDPEDEDEDEGWDEDYG